MPDRFSQEYLKTILGLKSTADRALIPLLRSLGFLDQAGAPTNAYRLLKNSDTAKQTLGKAVRTAYAPLFDANEAAHTLASDKLKGLIAQVAGTDDAMTARISQTFNALTKSGTFDVGDEDASEDAVDPLEDDDDADSQSESPRRRGRPDKGANGGSTLLTGFHYDIHVHLPSNGSEDVYLNIFNALRKSFR